MEPGDQRRGAGAIAIDGVPGLLCPAARPPERSAAALWKVKAWFWPVPCRGRIRKKMLELYQQGVDVKLEYPKSLPADILLPEKEMLLYGSYGILSCMDSLL